MRNPWHWMQAAICMTAMLPGIATTKSSVSGPAGSGSADLFPSRTVTIVPGVAAGASNDIEARLYAQKPGEYLRQPFLVDYKPGAGQTMTAAYVAKSAPDGYTVLNITPTPALYRDLPYDPVRDFAAVSLMSGMPYLILVSPSVPVRTPAIIVSSLNTEFSGSQEQLHQQVASEAARW